MATTTTRLSLIKPDFTDVVDISDLNSNADDIDANIGAVVVTSTTRPASPFTGQFIYETDTLSARIWNGTQWVGVGGAGGSLADTLMLMGA
jgi:hypothetical protein